MSEPEENTITLIQLWFKWNWTLWRVQ